MFGGEPFVRAAKGITRSDDLASPSPEKPTSAQGASGSVASRFHLFGAGGPSGTASASSVTSSRSKVRSTPAQQSSSEPSSRPEPHIRSLSGPYTSHGEVSIGMDASADSWRLREAHHHTRSLDQRPRQGDHYTTSSYAALTTPTHHGEACDPVSTSLAHPPALPAASSTSGSSSLSWRSPVPRGPNAPRPDTSSEETVAFPSTKASTPPPPPPPSKSKPPPPPTMDSQASSLVAYEDGTTSQRRSLPPQSQSRTADSTIPVPLSLPSSSSTIQANGITATITPPSISRDSRNRQLTINPTPDVDHGRSHPNPNLISKREDRSLAPSKGGGIGITSFVKAAEGVGPRGSPKPQMVTSPCICCAATLQYPKTISSFRCTVCGTITDIVLSERRAAGLAKGTDPLPLSLARFQQLLTSARHASDTGLSSSPTSSHRLDEGETDNPIADARTLEGESGGEEEQHSHAQAPGPESPNLTSASKCEVAAAWWTPLASELLAVFSHWSSLSGSFQTGAKPSLSEPGINMAELRAFYDMLLGLPEELGAAVVKGLEGLLRRPRRRFDAASSGKGLSWVLVILECPFLFIKGASETQAAQSVIKRFLGIVSNLANDQHHFLVFWFSELYSPEEFQRRIELINLTIVPRIQKHMHTMSQSQTRRHKRPLPYLYDWRFRSAARTLSLFFASNALRPQVPISSFYLTLLDNLNVVDDYESWIATAASGTSSKSAFFLSQYPFMMSLGLKLHILIHDSKKQQTELASKTVIGPDGRRVIRPHYLTLRIRRERLLEDSLAQLSSSAGYLKRALKIEFAGEEGVDAGGLRKEWFLLLVRELLDQKYGMWVTDPDSNLCWFNPASLEAAEQYALIGVVVGLAVYHASTLDIPLPGAAFKRLLNKQVTLDDLAEWQPALARGLRELLVFEGDVESTYCRSFVGEYESFGEVITVPLVPGGEDIPLTGENRAEYVDRLVQFMLVDSVSRQFKAFQRGWLSVCEGNALSLLHAEEIERLVKGSPEPLDVGQLRAVTHYEGFDPEDPLIESFWAIVNAFSLEQQRKLLAFVTGSDRIPATGLVNLSFRIQAVHVPLDHLPSSHTCFNTLCLPRYRSSSSLQKKLKDALEMSSGFGLK